MLINLILYIIKNLKKIMNFLGFINYVNFLNNIENSITILCNNIVIKIKINYPKLYLLYLQYNKDKDALYLVFLKLTIIEQYIWAFLCDFKRFFYYFILSIFCILPFFITYKFLIFVYEKFICYIFLILDFLFLDIILKNLILIKIYNNIRYILYNIFYIFWFDILPDLYLRFRRYYTLRNIFERFIMRILKTFNLIIKFFVGIFNLIIKFFVGISKLIDHILDFIEYIILSIIKIFDYINLCKLYNQKLYRWYKRKFRRYIKHILKLSFRWLKRICYIYLIWYINVIFVYFTTFIKYIFINYIFSIFFKKERDKKILKKTKFWILNYKIFIINFDKFIVVHVELFYNLILFNIAKLLCKYDLFIFDCKYYKSIFFEIFDNLCYNFHIFILFSILQNNISSIYIPLIYDLTFIFKLIYNNKYKTKLIKWITNLRIINMTIISKKSLNNNKNRTKIIQKNRHSIMRKYYMNYMHEKYVNNIDKLTIYPEDWNRSYIYKIVKCYVIIIDIIKLIIFISIIIYIIYFILNIYVIYLLMKSFYF